jgi:type III restriction enzyme
MKLQFDSKQKYQLDAIQAVTDLFAGQTAQGGGFRLEKVFPEDRFLFNTTFVVGNNLSITEDQLLKNLQAVQKENELNVSETPDGLNFSVEMETGTGKTYVYLRTIHELNRKYGFKKFIIVVPSLAIKEGVLKNLQITKEHFDMLYEKPQMDFYVFDPKKRGIGKNFAMNNSLQVMVMNIDQFARAGNIIYQDSDWGVPIEFIKSVRPIVIVDEPQNMETENRKAAIGNLNPLCTLRYSATHKFHYNLIYSLDPVSAYDLGLVKKIEVDGVELENSANQAFVQLVGVTSKKNKLTAKLRVDALTRAGVARKDITVRAGDDLYELSNKKEIYRDGFIVDELNATDQSITFSNGTTLKAGGQIGGLSDEVMKFQIENTVRNHFEKELKFRQTGKDIKVLSLFFIDKVANYRQYENGTAKKGKIAEWFEEAYNRISRLPKYKGLWDFPVEKIHNGYFSVDNKGNLKDTSGDTQTDDDTYTLIMKDKERLLSMEEPLRFIFSHSALREGWDNPNVFQICTLNETQSGMKKRQEIGRGLRLPVDSEGKRIFDASVNILTVVANESYEDFARTLQMEIEEECGVDFSGRIKAKKKRKVLKLNKCCYPDYEAFKLLWEKIKHKTRYNVAYSSDELIERASKAITELTIPAVRLVSRRAALDITKEGIDGNVLYETAHKSEFDHHYIPDVLGYIQAKTKLTKDTICKILKKADKISDILINPQFFMDTTAGTINNVLNEMMVDGIKYEKIAGQIWEMALFEAEELEGYLNDTLTEIKNKDKTLYDYVLVDSNVERDFVKELDHREDVKFYFKLPFWFKIETPIGTYNPDWAIVFENDRRLYFVAETKGTNKLDELKLSEKQKIRCGKKHFEEFRDVCFAAPIRSLQDLKT